MGLEHTLDVLASLSSLDSWTCSIHGHRGRVTEQKLILALGFQKSDPQGGWQELKTHMGDLEEYVMG